MTQENETNLSKLDWDIQPERDLWPDIETAIRFTGKPKKNTSRWAPMAIAACTVMAVVSVCFSLLSYQRSNQSYEMQAKLLELQQSHIALMDQQHKLVRAQFVALLQDNTNMNPLVAANLRATLNDFDNASSEIKSALAQQPMNSDYATALADTYQREADLLKQFLPTLGDNPNRVINTESI